MENSHLGVEMASSVILQEKFWEDIHDFPKSSFFRLKGANNDLDRNLFHAKIMIVNDKDLDHISDDSLLYFGSHNFSPSAWGNIEKNNTQISLNNWELGIVFPPQVGSAVLKS